MMKVNIIDNDADYIAEIVNIHEITYSAHGDSQEEALYELKHCIDNAIKRLQDIDFKK